jgi:ABC-type Mn2+/Zn2+ transport system ATPase subunit
MSEPIYFLRLEIENFRCFKDRQVLDLSDGKGNWKKWTVILGDNGTGKSSLVQLLAGSEMEETKRKENLKKYVPKGLPVEEGFTFNGDMGMDGLTKLLKSISSKIIQ